MTKNNPNILCPLCVPISQSSFPRDWSICKCDWEMPEIEPLKISEKEIEEYWEEAVEKRTYFTLDYPKQSCRCKNRKNENEGLKLK